MNSFVKSMLLSFLISLIMISASMAQTYGQLFTKQEADEKFGPVLQSVAISKLTFESFLTQTNNYIMFKVTDNKVIVVDNKRNAIFPKGVSINSGDKFTLYSLSVVYDLLSKGKENTVYVEQRADVLSITTGGFTMEVGVWCPPMCD